jgi:hypothetical protein
MQGMRHMSLVMTMLPVKLPAVEGMPIAESAFDGALMSV